MAEKRKRRKKLDETNKQNYENSKIINATLFLNNELIKMKRFLCIWLVRPYIQPVICCSPQQSYSFDTKKQFFIINSTS